MCRMLKLTPEIVFFAVIHVFLQLSRMGLFGTNSGSLHLKNLSCWKYSFQKLTQFAEGKNVLDAPVSNTDGFLSRGTCVSTSQLIGLFGTKRAFLHLENTDV
jgi:hypothetical protein